MTASVAPHFDDAQQQQDAATLGMWLFLGTEVLFFGGLFLGYVVYRSWYPAAFAEGSHHLSVLIGTINTAVLLTSSLTMALAVHASQTGKRKAIVAFLVLTMLLGGVFLAVKAFEYADKFQHRLVPGPRFLLEHPTNPAVHSGNVQLYFGFYFAMTGMHALHMVIGIGVLTVIAVLAGRGRFSAEYYTPVELTGLYWHFVDIVWVFLFPLLYLIG
jgi:cytochrome c oxidase subunit III